MKILAVDTSSLVASVAITENMNLLGEFTLNHKKTHSQKLMTLVKELLDNLELTPHDIDIFSASSGPGSFTGLRIGVTTIKAIAYAAQKPVVSIPTLDALAFNVPVVDALICPIMDARNDQVYTALYQWEKNLPVKITEYMGIHMNEFIQVLKGKNKKVIFTGDAVEKQRELLKEALNDHCSFATPNLLQQRASSVAFMAYVRAIEGLTENCFDMTPFYLRKSQAERELEKKQLTGNNE